jgi:hypothetical protein
VHTKNASELGYANAALVLGLIEVLASKGVLTRSDLSSVMVDAIGKLELRQDVVPTGGPIELIKSLLPDIRGST